MRDTYIAQTSILNGPKELVDIEREREWILFFSPFLLAPTGTKDTHTQKIEGVRPFPLSDLVICAPPAVVPLSQGYRNEPA